MSTSIVHLKETLGITHQQKWFGRFLTKKHHNGVRGYTARKQRIKKLGNHSCLRVVFPV